MNKYSITKSLMGIAKENDNFRAASMPGVKRSMEGTALLADYSKVQKYANNLTDILDGAVGAEVEFSTADKLYVDLRNRKAHADSGDCSQNKQVINLPSGETYIAPYEATAEDLKQGFGESKTAGILPVMYKDEGLARFEIKNNRIQNIYSENKGLVERLTTYFNAEPNRRNIAELGLGCNPNAVISGSVLEDEKVGLHIAYGTSAHLGGKVVSDLHEDIVYAKGCPIEGVTVTLKYENKPDLQIIQNSMLQYSMLKGQVKPKPKKNN
jgi:leucyl aminopeptidase (aminopeptidase T)